VLDELRNVFLGKGEVRRFETVNGPLALVGDDDVDEYQLGAGAEVATLEWAGCWAAGAGCCGEGVGCSVTQ
jgi:hypothetical protein